MHKGYFKDGHCVLHEASVNTGTRSLESSELAFILMVGTGMDSLHGHIESTEILWTFSVVVVWTVAEQTDFSEGVVGDTAISGKTCEAHTHRKVLMTMGSTKDNRMTSRITGLLISRLRTSGLSSARMPNLGTMEVMASRSWDI